MHTCLYTLTTDIYSLMDPIAFQYFHATLGGNEFMIYQLPAEFTAIVRTRSYTF